jgi:hypothetical protein
MAKFRIKFKLQALELEVEGSRDDVPLITQNLGQQFSGLLLPAANIVGGEIPADSSNVLVDGASTEPNLSNRGNAGSVTKKRPSRKKHATGAPNQPGDGVKDEAVNWRHDPAKWGSPRQEWKTANKAIWLLYVVAHETDQKELTSQQIAATFNKHFRQAKQVLTHNVTRDLGKLKVKADAPVSEDTTMSPSPWYLTNAGDRLA